MSKTIFDLGHIFVVFHPGASGNFITGLLSRILSNNLSQLDVSASGSSHTRLDKKVSGTDYISFGTEVIEQLDFENETTRIEFYKNKIHENYADVNTPQVIWSHDFTNIPVYKKVFPNSKIVVITQSTPKEKLVVLMMHVIKTLMDNSSAIPVTKDRWDNVLSSWKFFFKHELIKILGNTDDVTVDRILNDPNYLNLKLWATFNQIFKYYRVEHFIDNSVARTDLVNFILYPSKSKNAIPPFKIGMPYLHYISKDCITIPYSYLLDNNVDMLIQSVEQVIGSALSTEQRDFVCSNFAEYRKKQNKLMLNDPVSYYNVIKDAGLKESEQLKLCEQN